MRASWMMAPRRSWLAAAVAWGTLRLHGLFNPSSAIRPDAHPLPGIVQVNTSGEPQKGGVEDNAAAAALAVHIHDTCPHLVLVGLMTVGASCALRKARLSPLFFGVRCSHVQPDTHISHP